jgi:hypothetical protein
MSINKLNPNKTHLNLVNSVNNNFLTNKVLNKEKTNLFISSFKIIQWNCNSIWNKTEELNCLISDFSQEIICLNETKISDIKANYLNKNPKYCYYSKVRKDGGGGVAIIV